MPRSLVEKKSSDLCRNYNMYMSYSCYPYARAYVLVIHLSLNLLTYSYAHSIGENEVKTRELI